MVPIVLVSAALVGCAPKNDLTGKWTGSMKGKAANFDFTKDGKMTISMEQPPIKFQMLGDYKVEGETLSMTLKDIKLEGLPKGQEALAGMLKQAMQKETSKTEKMKLAFPEKDKATLTTDKGEKVELTKAG